MRWLLRVLWLVLFAIAALSTYIALQPGAFKVARTATIAAPPAKVFEAVNDLHKWEAWSPWAKLDPNAKATFEGPAAGVGAAFAWVGNSEIGEGRMTIKDSKPAEKVIIKLDFIKPMEGTSDIAFDLKPAGTGTEVTWTMTGEDGFMGKAARLVMDIDKMVGNDFEKGLARLKATVEAK